MAKYTPDSTFNNNARNGFFKNRPQYTKSHTFYIKTPRNEDEKKVKLVIWISDIGVASKTEDKDTLNYLTGARFVNDKFDSYFDVNGNLKAHSGFFELPKKNPKDGQDLKDSNFDDYSVNAPADSPNSTIDMQSLFATQDNFKVNPRYGEEFVPPAKIPITIDDYIDDAIINVTYQYHKVIYGVVYSSKSDYYKYDLLENKVEFVQTTPPDAAGLSASGLSASGLSASGLSASTELGLSASTTGASGGSASVDTSGSKITLRKSSGPGELIGIVEHELVDNKAVFDGLQFSEPGDYIISAVASVAEIGSLTFSISIKPADEIIEQASTGNTQSTPGNRPIIAQIDKPTYNLPPIKFPIQTATKGEAGALLNTEIANNIGFKPFLYYNGAIMKEADIKSMEIFYDGLLPRCEVSFGDSNGLLSKSENKPTDDSKFEIFLTSNSKFLKPIHLKMKILNHEQNKRDNSISFSGSLDIPNFYKINEKSYDGTSFEVFRALAKELTLGYNSNIMNTDDKMVWKASNKKYENFMTNIMKHSYISDDSFVTGYIDYYYCFNYVDVEKEWKRDISLDIGIDSTAVTSVDPKNKETGRPTEFTNDFSMNSSSFYFSKWEIKNDSTEVSTNSGQFIKSMVYDRLKKTFQVFDVQSLTSKGSDKLILKGAASDDKEHKTNFRTIFSGFIDTENTHPNYLYAETQNKVNFQNLSRIKAELILPQPNYNLYKYQKITLKFINQKTTATDKELADARLSGEWIVTDIRYSWQKATLLQMIDVCRKEYGKTKDEINNEKVKPDKKANNENNPNPETGTASVKPNDAYEEGKEYTIRDSQGLRYLIKVTKKLENGNEIAATISPLDKKGPFPISGTTSTTGSTDTGAAGTSGTSGAAGTSGTSGADGTSGTSGAAGTSGTSGAAGTSGSPTVSNEPEKDVYTIAVDLALCPNTDGFYTNVNGTITFEKIGSEYFAIGKLKDFANNTQATSRSNAYSTLVDTSAVANVMMINLENKVTNDPNFGLKGGQLILKIIGKSN